MSPESATSYNTIDLAISKYTRSINVMVIQVHLAGLSLVFDTRRIGVVLYFIERASGLAKRTNKDSNGFSTENSRKCDTIQPVIVFNKRYDSTRKIQAAPIGLEPVTSTKPVQYSAGQFVELNKLGVTTSDICILRM